METRGKVSSDRQSRSSHPVPPPAAFSQRGAHWAERQQTIHVGSDRSLGGAEISTELGSQEDDDEE